MIYQEGGIYHLFNRGCDRRNIFLRESNYRLFLKKMRLSKENYNLDVIAYCLMPNHFHLLVRQNSETTISKWIQKVLNGYVQSFNKQNDRKGTLFEGSTKPRLINSEEYLANIIHYLHYNPVKAKLVKHPSDWTHSSFKIWNSKVESSMIPLELRKDLFTSTEEYKRIYEEYVYSQLWDNNDYEK